MAHYRIMQTGQDNLEVASCKRLSDAVPVARYLSLIHLDTLTAVWKVTRARPYGRSIFLFKNGESLVPVLVKAQ